MSFYIIDVSYDEGLVKLLWEALRPKLTKESLKASSRK